MSRRGLAVLFAVLLASCGGGLAPASAPSLGVGPRSSFILANPGGLQGLDANGSSLGKITALPDQSAPSTPVLHPSGQIVAFALTQQPDPKRGFGSDIYAVNLDGSGLKPILLHEENNVFYASPRFDATGNVLYVHRRAAIMQNGTFTGNQDTIERLDLRSGQRTTLIHDGADPAISPDGQTIVYVHLTDGQIDALWRANIDGTDPKPLLTPKDRFAWLQAPRFRPTGCEIVFSGAGHTVARGTSGGKLAHLNIPSDLFLVPCDGSSLRSAGQTGDDVTPAWSPDGSKIAYVGTGGFFVLDLASGATQTIAKGQDFFFGDLVWLR